MNRKRPLRARVSPEEHQLLQQLRERKLARTLTKQPVSLGDRVSDKVAVIMGSWRFIIIQSIILAFWVILNVVALIQHWDPYPFILLNLMLSFQAAYAAPIIMMSQNRQAAIDREEAKHDYEIDQKAELEIELLQDKLTLILEEEIVELKTLLIEQQQQIQRLETFLMEQLKT
jgi:uncharacterized membrane protein